MTVGVLALQGAFAAHLDTFERIGVDAAEIRLPDDLDGITGLVIPGGESTTISKLLELSGLYDPIAQRIADGMAVFGTCAGLILLSSAIEDGRADQRSFGRLDIDVQRNGYGTQVESFEGQTTIVGMDEPFPTVFIRAPRISRVGDKVEVLAENAGEAVLVRNGNALGAAFHPELSNDARLHKLFLASID